MLVPMAEAETKTASKGGARKGPTTLARAYFKALDAHDLDAATALWKPGGIDRAIGLFELRAPNELRSWFGTMFDAFPDIRFEVITVVAQKNEAAVRWVGRGTFNGTGKFEGLSPNGASVELQGCDVFTVEDGQIVENNAYLNGADLARQLGALPPSGSAAEKAMTAALNAKVAAARQLEKLRDR